MIFPVSPANTKEGNSRPRIRRPANGTIFLLMRKTPFDYLSED
jgi:hypothetical protein